MSNQNSQILKNTNAQILDEFNASIMFDKELYAQDIKGSIAHSQMLCEHGILTTEESNDTIEEIWKYGQTWGIVTGKQIGRASCRERV